MVARILLSLLTLSILQFPFSRIAQAIPEGPGFPSLGWILREQANFSKISEAPLEQALNLALTQNLLRQGLANEQDWLERLAADPSWIDPLSGNTAATPLCALALSPICVGDPFRYPEAHGLNGDHFYDEEAEVIPVVFYDRDCARLSGRIWAPLNGDDHLPGVVIENGSLQAPETAYWWAAQAMVRADYAVMTFDPRSQGLSDFLTPDGQPGSNLNPLVFADNFVDAIDFFRSSSDQPYPHNESCAGAYPTEVAPFNPLADRLDPERLGIAGNSLGAQGVMKVQSYGAPGTEAWPGLLDEENPVDVALSWDGGSNPHIFAGGASNPLAHDVAVALVAFPTTLIARVPLMSQQSEYGLVPTPFLLPGKPDSHKVDFNAWKAAGVPVFQLTIQGSSHYEWVTAAGFPATSWCPQVKDGRCVGGWSKPLIEHYSIAWLDRWLKEPGEPGFCNADQRLLSDASWRSRYSFYFRSARRFPDRQKTIHQCTDIRAGCLDTVVRPACP